MMELKQQLKLSQQLVMTPQLQQAIKLLQLSRMELVDMVREELMENPVLEDLLEVPSRSGEVHGDSGEGLEKQAVSVDGKVSEAPVLPNEVQEESTTPKDAEKKVEEIDWDRYLENYTLQAPTPAFRADSEELPSIEATLTKRTNLFDHLMWQVKLSDFTDIEKSFAALVIGNLDDSGFLKEVSVTELADQASLDPEDAEEVLKIMQEFDPIGCCTRNLQECLLLQTRYLGLGDLAERIIKDFMPQLENKNFPQIARALNLPVEEVYEAAKEIGELDPRPGRNYSGDEPQYITPDVYVHKLADKYFVVPNDDGLPKLKISGFYRSALAADQRSREYIQSKLRSAQWLIRSIDQRRRTIIKVTEAIVEKQREFFDKGVAYLKPMILRDIAEAVGMHESTISRVTTNKYVHTPQGIFELKYFFNSAIKRLSDEDVASEAVKQEIKKIIAEEDAKNPYSDQKIVELLGDRGIVIARRTVAKYREMLGILSSSKRKQYF
ncbi:MAG: RNA polymerase factor sigma-54 [Deltaproteobacteria bacterium]|nr:RNA polymerase factor sigma-54 [Deltaproteobacteria bacterium]